MVIESQIFANCFNTKLFMNSVNRCKSVSKKLSPPTLPKLLLPTSHEPRATIMQNKPNFPKTKMNLNICSERNYENKSPIPSLRKQSQSNPIFSWCRVWSFGFGAWNLFGVLDLVLSPRRSKAKPGGILLLGDCTPESRAATHEPRLCKTNPIFQNTKHP